MWDEIKKALSLVGRCFKKAATWYAGLFKGRPWYIKLLSGIASFIVFIILYLGAVDINFLGLFGQSPSMDDIKNTRPPQASEIYSADGQLIGKFFSENRTPVAYEDVNPVFWDALIDTEDERFYSHYGIDIPAFFAVLKDFIIHRDARGASTITQQLAKNLFRTRTDYSTGLLGKLPGLRMLVVKSKEWVTAMKLEWNFSKQEILTMYANTVDFGSNAYGIKTACQTYFGISPKDLKAEQAALLVGMLKATTHYHPLLNPERSLHRRNVVLANMYKNGHLTKAAFDSLVVKPIVLNYNVQSIYDGTATYFREAVANQLRSWCNKSGVDLYVDGLRIYTTIDTRMQAYAEEAAMEHMKEVQKNFDQHWGKMNPWIDAHYREIPNFIENIARHLPLYKQLQKQFPEQPDSIDYYLNLPHKVRLFSYDGPFEAEMSSLDSIRYMARFMHCGFLAMEPETGHVKAWVGDIDFDTWKYDKVTSQRQPGSTFKLFVYTEAMNQGMTPCDFRTDMTHQDDENNDPWAPHNSNGSTSAGSMSLKTAFARSVNTIAVRLAMELGLRRVINTAHAMGIKSHLEEVPSLALGACDVSLLELVNAYCTVVNDGRTHQPVLVTKIVDRDGRIIYSEPTEQKQAIPYRSAFLMQRMLMAGLNGTSWSLRNYVGEYMSDTDFGGKTGTTNNNSDAWFVGVSPKLVVGAWVGGEYRAIHFRTGALGQGSAAALPLCGRFLRAVLGNPDFSHYRARFGESKDPSITSDMYECAGMLLADSIDIMMADQLNEFMLNNDIEDGMIPNEEITNSPTDENSTE